MKKNWSKHCLNWWGAPCWWLWELLARRKCHWAPLGPRDSDMTRDDRGADSADGKSTNQQTSKTNNWPKTQRLRKELRPWRGHRLPAAEDTCQTSENSGGDDKPQLDLRDAHTPSDQSSVYWSKLLVDSGGTTARYFKRNIFYFFKPLLGSNSLIICTMYILCK